MAGYRLSRQAAADLDDIYDYVPDDPGVTIARVLHSRMDVLLRFADAGAGARRT